MSDTATKNLSGFGEKTDSNGNEFLAFTLGKEEYGIDILKVQEIRGYEAVTRIANSPDFIKGVVNLRGIIVPIVDMRIKFQLGEPTYDQFTVVIILNIGGRVVGMVVDSVSDVITLNSVYDSTKLASNQLTQLFTETGWKMLRMCTTSRAYTVNICPTGESGAQRVSTATITC